MATVEILSAHKLSASMMPVINGLRHAMHRDGCTVRSTSIYEGQSEWLMLAGVGSSAHHAARVRQIANGGRVLHWDHGYFDREKVTGNMRMCIDADHPQHLLDFTPDDSSRWDAAGIALREDFDPDGHVVLVGMGEKSRSYLNQHRWEEHTFERLVRQYGRQRIVYRPKGVDRKRLPCQTDKRIDIADVLRGAALVVCRHSNVAVDATIAGVPFQAIDGAAMWLASKPFTVENRVAFLRRLAWWQWRSHEAEQAWSFCKKVANASS